MTLAEVISCLPIMQPEAVTVSFCVQNYYVQHSMQWRQQQPEEPQEDVMMMNSSVAINHHLPQVAASAAPSSSSADASCGRNTRHLNSLGRCGA